MSALQSGSNNPVNHLRDWLNEQNDEIWQLKVQNDQVLNDVVFVYLIQNDQLLMTYYFITFSHQSLSNADTCAMTIDA